MRRITVLAASAAGVCAFVNCFRPWHHRWGATVDEVALEMPGDELLSNRSSRFRDEPA